MTFYPVIMCGGAGSRLWPASRPRRPKQFLALAGQRSLFQETVLRVAPMITRDSDARRLIVVAGTSYADAIAAQLAELEIAATLLLEPEPRDSGPAMAAAAALVARRDPDGVMAIIASDHHIPDAQAFRDALTQAALEAGRGRIVTLGIAPTEASSAYGYICPAGTGLTAVERFVEKPNANTAALYVSEGYLWNSGNFIVSARTLLAELDVHAPEMAAAARASLPPEPDHDTVRLTEAFRAAPRLSIDYAVMEKSDLTSVLPVTFDWSDLGAWDSVLATGTGASGLHIGIDSETCLVRAPEGMVVATIGLKSLAVIVEPDAVLVADLGRSQDIKSLVERIKAEAPHHADAPDLREGQPYVRFADWMRTAALPLWSTLGVDDHGGFVEALDLDGRAAQLKRRARVQTRQIFVFCRAGQLGWSGPWRARVEAGLDRLFEAYVRPDGAIRNMLELDGSILDDSAPLYEQAFGLLALAAAHEAGVMVERCETHAGIMLETLLAARPVPGFGWPEVGSHPYQSNANMHLFEAAQAWEARGIDPRWAQITDHIANLALTTLIDPRTGALHEFFDADWKPAAGDDGRLIEPGHQFEWSWLLSQHGRTRGDARAVAAARILYDHGMRGVDPRRLVAVDALNKDLTIATGRARLWPQSEWLRAALNMAAHSQGEERELRLDDAAKAMRALRRYLSPNGTWRDKLDEHGTFLPEPAPASSLYHIMGALDQVCVAGRSGLLEDARADLT